MPENEPPHFSEELLERLRTTDPMDLLSNEERASLANFTRKAEEARIQSEIDGLTIFLD